MSAAPPLAPLRPGPPPPGAPPAADGAPPPAPPGTPTASDALLPAHVARLAAFVAFAAFGAVQWSHMVRPAANDALLGGVLVAACAGGVLAGVARRRYRLPVRIAATLLAAAALLVIALAAAGVPGELFGPHGWDDIAGGIAQGLGAVSTVRTPYGGADEWTRVVLVLGGCVLSALAALLAFAPRRRGAFGFPIAAALALGALYTVPVMQHDIRLPYLAGLLFALLLAAFLWLERVERRSAGLAAAIIAAAALGGFAVAPTLDGGRALLDYEELAQSLSPSATTQYRWNHSYGPLDWPRDGREVLRVRAKHRSYWKAVNLVAFDGLRWVQDTRRRSDPTDTRVFEPKWRSEIRVTMRALKTRQFVAAGSTLAIRDSPRDATSPTAGLAETTGDPLHRGHAYRAIVYAPRPTNAQLRSAGNAFGAYADVPRGYGVASLPASAAGGGPAVVFPWWREGGEPVIIGTGESARAALDASPYAGVYALARRLRSGAATPYEYVRRVERYLGRGFRYTETPPPSRTPLASFLLRDKAGYCQQFSGAMALLLRMGGVPARVASGFSPGILDTERGDYVVRDIDAHSWVEVFTPGIGWVTRDPTPADSPARAQASDAALGSDDDPVTFSGSERALDRAPDAGTSAAPASSDSDEGSGVGILVIGAVVLSLVVVSIAGLLLARRLRRARRRGRDPAAAADAELAELRRALRRSGRMPPPQMTLDALAERLAGTPAQDYVRTLADARFGYGSGRPTRAQRTALRRELGAGLGPRGRLRAWWALPPR